MVRIQTLYYYFNCFRLSVEEFLLMFTKTINIEGIEQTMSFEGKYIKLLHI